MNFAFVNGENWVLSVVTNTVTNTIYRSNGVYRQTGNAGAFETQFAINAGKYGGHPSQERSDFVVAEILIYDRILTHNEILQVENYLNNKYNIFTVSSLPLPPYSVDLTAYYYTGTYNNNDQKWYDATSNNLNSISSAGTPSTKVYYFPNGRQLGAVTGGLNDGLTFPSNMLTSTSTIFVLSKYDDNVSQKGRIFNGVTKNWLIGHHPAKSGVCYMGTWIRDGSDLQNEK